MNELNDKVENFLLEIEEYIVADALKEQLKFVYNSEENKNESPSERIQRENEKAALFTVLKMYMTKNDFEDYLYQFTFDE